MYLLALGCEIQHRIKAAVPTIGFLIAFRVFAKDKAPYAFSHFFSKYKAKCIWLNKDKTKEAELQVFNFTNWLSSRVGCLGTLLKP